jgi:CheY-like chemotaxis protein
VLVVDDNAVNQTVARAILEAAGVAVATVGDGHQAWPGCGSRTSTSC